MVFQVENLHKHVHPEKKIGSQMKSCAVLIISGYIKQHPHYVFYECFKVHKIYLYIDIIISPNEVGYGMLLKGLVHILHF